MFSHVAGAHQNPAQVAKSTNYRKVHWCWFQGSCLAYWRKLKSTVCFVQLIIRMSTINTLPQGSYNAVDVGLQLISDQVTFIPACIRHLRRAYICSRLSQNAKLGGRAIWKQVTIYMLICMSFTTLSASLRRPADQLLRLPFSVTEISLVFSTTVKLNSKMYCTTVTEITTIIAHGNRLLGLLICLCKTASVNATSNKRIQAAKLQQNHHKLTVLTSHHQYQGMGCTIKLIRDSPLVQIMHTRLCLTPSRMGGISHPGFEDPLLSAILRVESNLDPKRVCLKACVYLHDLLALTLVVLEMHTRMHCSTRNILAAVGDRHLHDHCIDMNAISKHWCLLFCIGMQDTTSCRLQRFCRLVSYKAAWASYFTSSVRPRQAVTIHSFDIPIQ